MRVVNIKAIETSYNGYRFRSRLEARWAVFFDAIGVKYEYEPEGFELPSGRYLPDFWVPEWRTWLEVKPEDGITTQARVFAEELCLGSGYPVLISDGVPKKHLQGEALFVGYKFRDEVELCKQEQVLHKIQCVELILEELEEEEPNCKLDCLRRTIKWNVEKNFFVKNKPTVQSTSFNFFVNDFGEVCPTLNPFTSIIAYTRRVNDHRDQVLYTLSHTYDCLPTLDGYEFYYFQYRRSQFNEDRLDYAIEKSKSARFEHGEAPRLNVVPQCACSL